MLVYLDYLWEKNSLFLHPHPHTRWYTHKHTNTQTHKHTRTHAHKYIKTNTQTHKHINSHTHTRTHTLTYYFFKVKMEMSQGYNVVVGTNTYKVSYWYFPWFYFVLLSYYCRRRKRCYSVNVPYRLILKLSDRSAQLHLLYSKTNTEKRTNTLILTA